MKYQKIFVFVELTTQKCSKIKVFLLRIDERTRVTLMLYRIFWNHPNRSLRNELSASIIEAIDKYEKKEEALAQELFFSFFCPH